MCEGFFRKILYYSALSLFLSLSLSLFLPPFCEILLKYLETLKDTSLCKRLSPEYKVRISKCDVKLEKINCVIFCTFNTKSRNKKPFRLLLIPR